MQINKNSDGNIVSIKCKTEKSENVTKWKVWSKNVDSHTFDGHGNITATRPSNVAIAINVADSNDGKSRYLPVEGQVFTFFPLSDHMANLKFHLHGPFAINLERTNLQESTPLAKEENNRLINEISTLLASAVQNDLETNNDLDILALMPIESDNSSPRFKIITDSVRTLLSKHSLINDIKGVRRTSGELLMIGTSLENLLIDSNLEEIHSVTTKSDMSGKQVAIFKRTSNSRINSFLHHVGVGIVGDKELKIYFTRINDAFTFQKSLIPYSNSNLPIPSNLQMYKKMVDTFKNWINSKTDLQITNLLLALGKSRIETIYQIGRAHV